MSACQLLDPNARVTVGRHLLSVGPCVRNLVSETEETVKVLGDECNVGRLLTWCSEYQIPSLNHALDANRFPCHEDHPCRM